MREVFQQLLRLVFLYSYEFIRKNHVLVHKKQVVKDDK